MKILISAYSCQPGGPSEQDVGWNWAVQAARDNEVWVLTNEPHAPKIEAMLARHPVPNLHFDYHDMPTRWVFDRILPRNVHALQYAAYLAWQRSARKAAMRLHEKIGFDVTHHVTWATHRFPSCLAPLDVPFIWGPIGGGETAPLSYYRSMGHRTMSGELARDASNLLTRIDPFVRTTANRASRILTTTTETRASLSKANQSKAEVYPAIGLDTVAVDRIVGDTPLRKHWSGEASLLFVGRLFAWKGCDLAIEALARVIATGTQARLSVVGVGPEEQTLRGLAARLGVADRVDFLGALPREEVLRLCATHDAFVFPSLHDSGGIVVIEAMYLGLPVVCLDIGGPALSVGDAGVRVKCATRQQVVQDLGDGILSVLEDLDLRDTLTERARDRVLRLYDWRAKPAYLSDLYQRTIGKPVGASRLSHAHVGLAPPVTGSDD